MRTSTVNILPYLTYSSPRYHTYTTAYSWFEEDDYPEYDAVNGTYDKYWPLYGIHENAAPKLQLILPDNSEVPIKGDLGIYQLQSNYTRTTFGDTGYVHFLKNNNLDQKQVDFNLYFNIKLTPGWSTLQLLSTESAAAGFCIRANGSATTMLENHSFTVPDELENNTSFEFPAGTILKFKGLAYRCLKTTSQYPTEKTTNELWEYLEDKNVFDADVFSIYSTGYTKYIKNVKDPERNFEPEIEIKNPLSTLVGWNLSYYES